jgi:hypothetical protein
MAEAPPPQTADNAVRAFILLFALGFMLRGIDMMDDSMWSAVQKWAIAAALSVVDYFYVPVRTRLGPRFAETAAKVATDFRWWTVAIIFALVLPFSSLEQRRWSYDIAPWQAILFGFAIAFAMLLLFNRRHPQNASIELGRPILAVQDALVMHTCRIIVTADALDRELYLDIDVVQHPHGK